MHMRVDVPVDVLYHGDAGSQSFRPIKLQWNGRPYKITAIGLHHRSQQGRTRIHTFTVDTDTLSFRLEFNTETLETRLLEIHDGEPG